MSRIISALALLLALAACGGGYNSPPRDLDNACSIAQSLDISMDWLLLERGSPEAHQDRSITGDEARLLLQLRRRPERIKALVQQIVAEIPEDAGFRSEK